MFGSKKKEKEENNRFYIKSIDHVPTLGRITILVDRETGANYIHSWVGTGSGITPLLDEKGEVIVDE
ncbi:hypothetical protein SAMN04487943_102144 [Gracilibacillus orientalis]|uniref:DUF6440 domain-containing protein n=1 Tax=Gracilibacillus orientalis TaxID=334253 RepID=A0A1I4IJ96_9BACI|nr:DUF6440 family protein [Gracilibacillus orientalis]SFL54345.1 hypothetical protein SAMN04487943_102144 [Gracilibacillus orientalis]